MASKIEWTGETWNPIAGCSIVSPGCTNCYAMRMAARLAAMAAAENARRTDPHHGGKTFDAPASHYLGLTKPSKAGPVWTGKVALAPERTLFEPLRRRKPTTYFVNSMSDLFHEDVPDWWIWLVLAVMADTHDVSSTDERNVITGYTQRHVYQVLTKRSKRMQAFMAKLHTDAAAKLSVDEFLSHPFSEAARRVAQARGEPIWMNAPLTSWQWVHDGCPGLWLGVSCERQQEADARIPDLLATPAAVRFVSAEPLLGAIDFTRTRSKGDNINALRHVLRGVGYDAHLTIGGWQRPIGPVEMELGQPSIDWIIVGGESGPGARPMHPDWARAIRDQCARAGTAFFFKQWGAWLVGERQPQPDDLKWSPDVVFPDGSDFAVVSDGHDILLSGAEDEKAGPKHLWREYWGWQGHLIKRAPTKSLRLLDGRTHDAYPERAKEVV